MSLFHSVLLITNDTVAREQSCTAVMLWVENVAIEVGEGEKVKLSSRHLAWIFWVNKI